MRYYYSQNTPVGPLCICADEQGITKISFNKVPEGESLEEETPIIKQAFEQLAEYFNGERKQFDLPLNLQGTDFQKKVWGVLQSIPYGETWSYKQVATAAGNPKASRAVGMANNRNPIAIVVPCHRVIGANGALVGYAGGLEIKKSLLEVEKKKSRKKFLYL
ncbi:methylated-DNA--[protein]-cysteine S-methyltransferase [uncultured Bacteroides sp.]|uniref:methylated-DNA--[protein]-cysteine S-methyltransferase n=1 Tax=uncultured Bacteroides sp. TaxID=162156 RepID=UPI002AA844DF|nr:methylated-DNA--[protein]-cysteine S-methyltransferase [uncultured Bacteroides sp.]